MLTPKMRGPPRKTYFAPGCQPQGLRPVESSYASEHSKRDVRKQALLQAASHKASGRWRAHARGDIHGVMHGKQALLQAASHKACGRWRAHVRRSIHEVMLLTNWSSIAIGR
mmetsp:Transcript_66357/g.197456  ORF Transcript_66357/g.197456 Transcript_66357/m.197456 type:complete len:112 (-) Transcript_66357:1087-1422(-)